jgi:hypothetical protein
MTTWLSRYMNEDPASVWRELVVLGDRVRDPAVLPDALSVAREAALRVRRNVEILSERWTNLGFRFGYAWAKKWADDEVHRAPPHLGQPGPQETAALARFEAEAGPLPLSLRAFYERMGALNFVGMPVKEEDPIWPHREELDPLQVDSFPSQLDWLLSEAGGERKVHVCPDHLHKFFISGVGSLMAPVPDAGADVVLTFEGEPLYWNEEPLFFMDYLREVILRRGGVGIVTLPGAALRLELLPGLQPF